MKKTIYKIAANFVVMLIFILNVSVFFASSDVLGSTGDISDLKPDIRLCYVGTKNINYETERYCGDCQFYGLITVGDGGCRSVR